MAKRPTRLTLAMLEGEELTPSQRAHPSKDVMTAATVPSKISQATLEISLCKLSWAGKERCVPGWGSNLPTQKRTLQLQDSQ